MSTHPVIRLWPIVALWLAAGGCGGAQTRAAARAGDQPTAAGGVTTSEESPPDARAEIDRLDREIRARTAQVPPDRAEPAPGAPPGVNRPGTPEGDRVCDQACHATGSICQAAQRICSLADEMDDDWARGKCRAATRTCTDTRRRASNACGAC